MTKSYDVGYGKPPTGSRYKPGQSGNPAGRKKGSKNLATLVNAALYDTVVINSGGKRRTVSKLEAAFIQQSNKAAGGDLKATKLMVDILAGAAAMAAASEPGDATTLEARRTANLKIMTTLITRLNTEDD